jgi:hypothetical protein
MNASLALRRRNGWEAADSGILLWRNNLPYLLFFFVLPVLGIILAFMCIRSIPAWVGILLLWWLKPLFDHLMLHVIAVRFFENRASVFRLFRGLGKSLGRGLAGDLLWRRFSPLRSVVMPIRTLENPKTPKGRRIRALQKGCLNFGVLLSCLGLGMEVVLLAGELVFFVILIELFNPSFFIRFLFYGTTVDGFFLRWYSLNYVFVESLYVCMGFGVYINSRVEVEGWDIQLLFQNFVEKRKIPRTVAVLLVIPVFLFPPGGFTQTPMPAQALEEVLSSRDFGGETEGWGIRLRSRERDKTVELPLFSGPPWAEDVREWTARGFRLFLIAAAAGLAGVSLFRLRGPGRGKPPVRMPRDHGIPAGEGPAALLAKARDRYARGELRAAWAACLAAAFGACESRGRVLFPPGATEYECLALVRSREDGWEITEGFAFLVENWISLAYGGAVPRSGAFERVLDFCQSLLDNPAGDHA